MINGLYLTFRGQPNHFEATAVIMGQWETIGINIVSKDCNYLIVNLITANGMYFAMNSVLYS